MAFDIASIVTSGVDSAIKSLTSSSSKDSSSGQFNAANLQNNSRGLMMPMERAKGPTPTKPVESVNPSQAVDNWMSIFKQIHG